MRGRKGKGIGRAKKCKRGPVYICKNWHEFVLLPYILIRSDTIATIFSLFILVRLLLEGSYYLRAATIQGWHLIEEIQ